MKMVKLKIFIAAVSLIIAAPALAQLQGREKRVDIWSIELGSKADQISKSFVDIACGTNGGPPGLTLKSFSEFMKCRPENSGLREVYFRYDDELEYWARAMELDREIKVYRGTQMYDYPVIISVLIDDSGIVQGRRITSDARYPEIRERQELWTLGNFLLVRFTRTDWTCVDLPAEEGETPVGDDFVKNRCVKSQDSLRYLVEQRYLRRKGQTNIDPNTGKIETNAFTSTARFEMYKDPYGQKAGL
ncbi:MAG: hypothetical protein EBY21_11180 [Alphaproteobacteria bacterium]|nr:hypothetical protein [Alphaproteobacteria bacterium]